MHIAAVTVHKLIFSQSKADDDAAAASDPSGSDIKHHSDPKNPDSEVIVPVVRTGVNAAIPAGKNMFQGTFTGYSHPSLKQEKVQGC